MNFGEPLVHRFVEDRRGVDGPRASEWLVTLSGRVTLRGPLGRSVCGMVRCSAKRGSLRAPGAIRARMKCTRYL
jgi:hypothetical protein